VVIKKSKTLLSPKKVQELVDFFITEISILLLGLGLFNIFSSLLLVAKDSVYL